MGVGQAIPAVTLAIAWALGDADYDLVIAVLGLAVSVLVSARMTGLLDRISEQSVQLAALARSDDLTGLHNRRSWNHELSRACAAARDRGHRLSIALIDLDHFKRYNDTHGHPAGDRLLRECASTWGERLGPNDVLARYGGEEFAVILPGSTLEDAVLTIDQLRARHPGRPDLLGGRRAVGARHGPGGGDRAGRRGALPGQAVRPQPGRSPPTRSTPARCRPRCGRC